jgi:uncharacterized membrane protein YoaK (UPF0700 family)
MLLFLLAISAGASDGWSFFGFGAVFVANMTGNTVLLGISFFHPQGNLLHSALLRHGDTLHPLLAIASYAAGVAIASYVTGKRMPRFQNVIWTRTVSHLLAFEALCLAAVETAWYVMRPGGHGAPLDVMLSVTAMCMGLQSGAMLQLRVPGIVTTYITGTWTQMVRGLTRLAAGERPGPREAKVVYEERVTMQAVTLAVYFMSAVLTGWLLEKSPKMVGVVPVLCLATAAVWGLLRGGAYSVEE